MPSGIIHENLRVRGRVFIFPLAIFVTIFGNHPSLRPFSGVFIGTGIFLGYEWGAFCCPDWDIVGMTRDEGRMINEIPILGHFLVGASTTYGSIFRKHHRSFITHFPFVATGIRYIYMFWWIWYQIYWSRWDLAWLVFLFVGMYIGTSLSDLVHWMADFIWYPKSE